MNESQLGQSLPAERRLSPDRRHALKEALMARIDAEPPTITRRAPRRGRRALLAATMGVTVVAAGTLAAATDLWSGPPAPKQAQQDLGDLERMLGGDGRVDQGRAVELARSGGHVLYGAPTTDGGYCITIGTDRGAGQCTPFSQTHAERAFWFGTEGRLDPVGSAYLGGTVFGRVTDARAASVEIQLPQDVPAAKAVVGAGGFFIATLPEAAWRAQLQGAETGPATVLDVGGNAIGTFDSAGNRVPASRAGT
jgi:hypothetical protein